jgi:hypothetical protein
MKIVSKKHWYSYAALIITIPLCYILIFKVPVFLNKYIGGITLIQYIRYVPSLYGIWLLYVSIFGPLRYASTKWVFEDDYLTIKSPSPLWNTGSFEIDISDIYEAYFRKTLVGSILGYADISVRRNDGTTSAFSESKMTNYNEIVGQINKRIADLKKEQKAPQGLTSNSLSAELEKLANMRKTGTLTEEEFTEMKRKLIK